MHSTGVVADINAKQGWAVSSSPVIWRPLGPVQRSCVTSDDAITSARVQGNPKGMLVGGLKEFQALVSLIVIG